MVTVKNSSLESESLVISGRVLCGHFSFLFECFGTKEGRKYMPHMS